MKFKATIRQIGNSHGIIIPSAFITNNYGEPNKEYWFEIGKEVNNE